MTAIHLVPRVAQHHPNSPACRDGEGFYFREQSVSDDYRSRRANGTLRNSRQLADFVRQAVKHAVDTGRLPVATLGAQIQVFAAAAAYDCYADATDCFVAIDTFGETICDVMLEFVSVALKSINAWWEVEKPGSSQCWEVPAYQVGIRNVSHCYETPAL